MAVLGRLILGSAERLDLPDLLSIDSYTASDFKYLIQSFIGADKPYILRGFDVIQPGQSIGTESISIKIANSVVYYPAAKAGSFFYGLEEGNVNAQPLVPELRKQATNYVYLTLTTSDTAKDNRAFWDPDQNGGDGGEFSQDINTETVLKVEVGVSTSTFPENTVPVCKVVMDTSVIISIEDSRDMLFRLGTGGASPDPFSAFNFRNNPSSTYARNEPSTLMTSALDANPFEGGDKNIFTLKEWMDVVMTRIKELSGQTYWYSGGTSGSPFNVTDIWNDTLGSSLRSKGQWQHDSTIIGKITWTEDLRYYYLTDPRIAVIRATSITLSNDGDVAYIDMKRDENVNTTATTITFTNGSTVVSGVVGAFENLNKGDWIKKQSDDDILYLRVEEFFANNTGSGGMTSPSLAQSIKLSGNYAGTTGAAVAVYTKGEFGSTDVKIDQRTSTNIDSLAGDFYWLAYRADLSYGLESITPTQLSIDITDADGIKAKCTVAAGHNLVDGDRVAITTGSYAGEYVVSVTDNNVFYINTSTTGDELGQTGFYAIVETRARQTQYAFELESAEHNLTSGERVYISGSSSAYDGNYLINVRSATTFQIPITSLIADPGVIDGEIVRSIRIHVRTEFGAVNILQGEDVNIGNPDIANLISYIGMNSISQTSPNYQLPPGYSALAGHENYNSQPDDDLTLRVAQLTAMMADRVQDRGFNLRGRVNIQSTTNGANQDITANGSLTLHKPSSPEQVINLTVSLPANSIAIANLDRDGGAAINLSVESLGSQYVLGENKLILFYRFNDTTVYTWTGATIEASGHLNLGYPEDSSNKNITLFNPGFVRLNFISGLLTFHIVEKAQTTEITTLAGNAVPQSSYFLINSANDATEYYVWYDVDAGGTDPALVGKTGIKVSINSADTDIQVATATVSAINTSAGADFTASNVSGTSNTVTIVNDAVGTTTAAADNNTTFSILTTIYGLDPDPEILIHGSTNKNIIDADAINTLGTLIVNKDQAVWVRVNRFASKTFNTVQTSDVPDTDTNGALYVTNISDVPIDQDVFVLWVRNNDNIVEMHRAESPTQNVYDEVLKVVSGVPADDNEVQGPITSGTELSLPLDSRDNNSVQQYIVGAGHLEVYLNGQYLRLGHDWDEVGVDQCPSNKIKILRDLVVNDFLMLRIDAEGSVYFASAGITAGTLQNAYDSGRFITIDSGQPVVISGPANEKLLSIQGDLDVTGVIDPTGIEFTQSAANPLTGSGWWLSNTDELTSNATRITIPELQVGSTIMSETNLQNLLLLQDGSDIGAMLHTHDNRYYTKSEVDSGQLDNRYYTETELNNGVLDARYYTEMELDAGQLDNRYYTEVELDAGQLDNRYYTETELSATTGSALLGNDHTNYISIVNPVARKEETQITLSNNSASFYDVNGTARHWLLYSAEDATSYYVWYNVTDGANIQSDPALAGKTGIQVDILFTDVSGTIAQKTATAISNAAGADFTTSFANDDVFIVNVAGGDTTDASDVTASVTATVNINGISLTSLPSLKNTLLAIDDTFSQLSKLFISAVNNTGGLIPAGSIVSASKTVAGEIILASAASFATANSVIGVAVDNIPNGGTGRIQVSGKVAVLGSPFLLGEKIYLSEVIPGSGTATPPTSLGSVVSSIGVAVSTTEIILNIKLEAVNSHSYEEVMTVVSGAPANDNEIQGPVTAGSNIELPLDSREGNNPQHYTVGSGQLQLFLNGQLLELGGDWFEIGSVNDSSNFIQINRDLVVGDELIFRIGLSGDVFVASGSGTGESNSGVNVGSGVGVFKQKLGINLLFRSLVSGAGIAITQNVDDITITNTAGGSLNTQTVTANTTLTISDDVTLVDATSGNIVISLPPAATVSGKLYNVKKIDNTSNSITIDPDGSELIDNGATLSTNIQYENFTIVCDGTKWWVL